MASDDGRFSTGGDAHITVNSTDDPRFPDGSYYVSVGEGERPDEVHETAVYHPDGIMPDVRPNRETESGHGWRSVPRQD